MRGLVTPLDQWQSGNPLAVRVKLSFETLFAESQLDPASLQELVQAFDLMLKPLLLLLASLEFLACQGIGVDVLTGHL